MAAKSKRVVALERALGGALRRLESLEAAGGDLMCHRVCSWQEMSDQVAASAALRRRLGRVLEATR